MKQHFMKPMRTSTEKTKEAFCDQIDLGNIKCNLNNVYSTSLPRAFSRLLHATNIQGFCDLQHLLNSLWLKLFSGGQNCKEPSLENARPEQNGKEGENRVKPTKVSRGQRSRGYAFHPRVAWCVGYTGSEERFGHHLPSQKTNIPVGPFTSACNQNLTGQAAQWPGLRTDVL